MASRMKERGGGGGKIMASKPLKTLTESTPKTKAAAATGGGGFRRTPVPSGKENPSKTLYAGRASGVRPSIVPKLSDKPMPAAAAAGGGGGGVRWSTSSLPRGKVPSPANASRLLSDGRGDRRLPRVSASDETGRALGKDLDAEARGRKSVGGIRALDKGYIGKGLSSLDSKGREEKLATSFRAAEVQKPKSSGNIGSKTVKKDTKSLDSNSEGKSKAALKSIVLSENCCPKDDANSSDDKGKDADNNTRVSQNEILLLALEAELGNIGMNRSSEIGQSKVFRVSTMASLNGKAAGNINDLNDTVDRDSFACSSKVQDQMLKESSGSVAIENKECLVTNMDRSKDDNVTSSNMRTRDLNNERESVNLDQKMEIQERKLDNIMVFEKKEDDVEVFHVTNKYPSKLHEKLALLEGKVQKIASEIKRTKEILDSSNPDESKMILYDIQNKISGIEKTVGQVVEGSKNEAGSYTNMQFGSLQSKSAISCKSGEAVSSAPLAKGLNGKELEARFFPHHKLLRSRDCLDTSSKADLVVEGKDGSLSPTDENSIAMEFLASLNPEKSDFVKHNVILKSGHHAIREVGIETNSSIAQFVSSKAMNGHYKGEIDLQANEKLEEFDDQEKKPTMVVYEDTEEPSVDQLSEIGRKPSTGGWFVSEGEAVLLAHDDGCCSYYDIANSEFKAEYSSPAGVPNNLWADCWLIRAPGADGCSGRYVVAASAGSTLESGFCSWDFYTRDVKAFHVEDEVANSFSRSSSRTVLAPLNNTALDRRSASCSTSTVERPQWWYRPCGPLLLSTSSRQKLVTAYDIRDGAVVMQWEVNFPVTTMEYSCPLQWRSRGKVIIAGTEAISLWDVNSLNPQPLLSVTSAGKKIYSLHVNNTDAELGGGVRQRVSSSEVEGNDGVFCTQESINVFDFRLPTGIGLKISRHGAIGHSIFSRGDSIYIGSTEGRLPIKGGPRSRVQQYSLRRGKLVTTYELPEFNAHFHHSSITQVWGNTNTVMSICGMGLFVFDALKDEGTQTFCFDRGNTVGVKETIGPDDLYCPTFDYLGSRVLVISKDRPAFWRYLF